MPAKTIVIVDDDKDCADTLALMCAGWGHRATATYSAKTALQLIKENPPDFMFVDLGMPEIDGLTAARKMRAEPSLKKTVLVAFTGFGGSKFRQASLDAGFDIYLMKPAEPNEIRRLLDPTDV